MADNKSSVWIAFIGALASIGVAFITTRETISSASPQLEQASATAEQLRSSLDEGRRALSEVEKDISIPVGTVVASLISPARFFELEGDPSVFDPKVSRWVLADRSLDITLSMYGRITGESRSPDLRGMFLRGIDTGRNDGKGDPAGERSPGHIQPDAFRKHSHSTVQMVGDNDVDGVDSTTRRSGDHHNQGKRTGVEGEDETRPVNAAVFYYLRIN